MCDSCVDFSLCELEDFTLLSLVFPRFFFKRGSLSPLTLAGRKMIFFTPYFSGFKTTNTLHICHPIPQPKLKIPINSCTVNLMASKKHPSFFRGSPGT